MPTVGSEARITRYRDRDLSQATSGMLDVTSDDELQFNAWWLHETVLERAKREGAPTHLHEGIAGYRWEGQVNPIVHDLWPHLSHDPNDQPSRDAKITLNSYLRQTRNMICLTPGNQVTPSTWWVRATFSEEPPPKPMARPTRPAEAKLTPAEAGEDRAPEPVVTGLVCPFPGCRAEPFPDKARRSQHYFAEHKSAEEFILEALRDLARPARIPEIHLAAERNGYPGSTDATRRALAALTEAGKLLHGEERNGATGGNPYVYALPEYRGEDWGRTQAKPLRNGEVTNSYQCREPGCAHPPFASADDRRSHENSAHPDQSSRPYPCKVRGCRDRFYSMPALAIHLGAGHRIARNTVRFRDLLERAIAEAEGKPQAEVTPEPAEPPEVTEAAEAAERQIKAERALTIDAGKPEPLGFADPVLAVQAIVTENAELREEVKVLRAENDDLRGRLSAITQAISGVGRG